MRKILPVLLIVLLVGCINAPNTDLGPPSSSGGQDVTKACGVPADCVAAECCHPRTSVNYQFAPECGEVACTLDCAPNTVDCGQGYFDCINNQCQTIINAPL